MALPFLEHSPNTAMILGAALSGGDPKKMAELLLQPQHEKEESLGSSNHSSKNEAPQ